MDWGDSMKILLWLKGLVGNKYQDLNRHWCIRRHPGVSSITSRACSRNRPTHGVIFSQAVVMDPYYLGLNAIFPQGNFDLYAGTLLWGSTPSVPNNWSWEAGLRACKAHLCASLGASYLQRTNG